MEWDYSKPWYHGSPLELTTLWVQSTITQDIELARVFSHKPSIVAQDTDDAGHWHVRHSGTLPGYLYRVLDPIAATDVYPHPESTMEHYQEWLTTRELRVVCIGTTAVRPEEFLTPAEVEALLQKHRP